MSTTQKQRSRHLARINGVSTTAVKVGRRWMVGGDFPGKGDSVQIAAQHKDVENGGAWWAWHKLRGAFLIFDDFLSDDELAMHLAVWGAK